MKPAVAVRRARGDDFRPGGAFEAEPKSRPNEVLTPASTDCAGAEEADSRQIFVDVAQLAPSPFYKRGPIDYEMEELASSLHDHGFIYPPTVRTPCAQTRRDYPDALYEIETGHRRVAAVQRLHLLELTREYSAESKVSRLIPVTLITGDDSMRERALLSLAENANRKALTPYEDAFSIGVYCGIFRTKVPNASLAVLAKRLNVSRSRVFEAIKIVDTITENVLREAGFVLPDGKLDYGKISRLKKEALTTAARAPSMRLRIELLQNGLKPEPQSLGDSDSDMPTTDDGRAALAQVASKPRRGRKKKASGGGEDLVQSFGLPGGTRAEYERLRRTGDFRIRFRGRPSDMTPAVAEAKLEMLQPAAVVLAERTLESDEHDGQHYLLVDDIHAAAIYFPTSLKSLSDREFKDLIQKMEAMRTDTDY